MTVVEDDDSGWVEWKKEVKAASARLDDGVNEGDNCLLSRRAVAIFVDEIERRKP